MNRSCRISLAVLPALLLATSCTQSSTKLTEPPPGAAVAGRVALLGAADSAGATVSIDGGPSVTTGAGGEYFFSNAPIGTHALRVQRGDWEEVVPSFVVAAGAGPQVLDGGALHPLPTIEVPRAHRLATTTAEVGAWYAAPATGELIYLLRTGQPLDWTADLFAVGQADALPHLVSSGVTWTGGQEWISPDGAHVLYAPRECVLGAEGVLATGSPLELVPTAGGATQRLADEMGCRAGFTPGGARVVYQLDQSVDAPLRSVPVTGGAPTDLGQGVLVEVSDERALIVRGTPAYGGVGPGELWSASLADGTGVLLATEVDDARFALGGTQVLFWTAAGASLVPVGGGTPRLLGKTGLGGLQFTSDGARVAWIRQQKKPQPNDLLVADVAGGDEALLGTTPGGLLVLSPDDQEAVVLGAAQADATVFALDAVKLADGARRTLTTLAGTSGGFTMKPWVDRWPVHVGDETTRLAAFTPDGADLYLYGQEDGTHPQAGLYRIPYAGGERVRVGEAQPFAFTPVGDRVIFFSATADLMYGTLASAPSGGGPTTVVAENAMSNRPISFSPDGSRVTFTVPEFPVETWCATLHVAPVAGGSTQPVLRHVVDWIWAGNTALYAATCQNQAPITWRDGVYRTAVP